MLRGGFWSLVIFGYRYVPLLGNCYFKAAPSPTSLPPPGQQQQPSRSSPPIKRVRFQIHRRLFAPVLKSLAIKQIRASISASEVILHLSLRVGYGFYSELMKPHRFELLLTTILHISSQHSTAVSTTETNWTFLLTVMSTEWVNYRPIYRFHNHDSVGKAKAKPNVV